MAITAPSYAQLARMLGFGYVTKAAKPLKDFCDAVVLQAPTSDQKAALAGTGTPSAANLFVTADNKGLISGLAGAAPTADTVSSAAGAVSTAFASKATVGAATLKAGDTIRIKAAGMVSVSGGGVNAQLTLKIGSAVIGAQTAALAVAANDYFLLEADVTLAAVGASGSYNSVMRSTIGHSGAGTEKNAYVSTKATSLDTTAARDITVLVDLAAGAGVTIDLYLLDVQVLHKA